MHRRRSVDGSRGRQSVGFHVGLSVNSGKQRSMASYNDIGGRWLDRSTTIADPGLLLLFVVVVDSVVVVTAVDYSYYSYYSYYSLIIRIRIIRYYSYYSWKVKYRRNQLKSVTSAKSATHASCAGIWRQIDTSSRIGLKEFAGVRRPYRRPHGRSLIMVSCCI
jgi:hypothetical protein